MPNHYAIIKKHNCEKYRVILRYTKEDGSLGVQRCAPWGSRAEATRELAELTKVGISY